jgi:hypothetical protein
VGEGEGEGEGYSLQIRGQEFRHNAENKTGSESGSNNQNRSFRRGHCMASPTWSFLRPRPPQAFWHYGRN